jgi:aminoglycoside phosphotransferase
MHDPVFRATIASGIPAYVRVDDGSAPLLRRLARASDLPAPRLLDHRDGWLLLEALPRVPLHDERWLARPAEAVQIIAEGLRCLDRNDVRHGDVCVPNMLGDLATSMLSGIVDWHYAGRFDREVDVASAIWSCGYNGYRGDVPLAVLEAIGWPRADAGEVERLGRSVDRSGRARGLAGRSPGRALLRNPRGLEGFARPPR